MTSCDHKSIKVLSVNTHSAELETQCEGCETKVLVQIETLPAFHVLTERPEWQQMVVAQAIELSNRILCDRDKASKDVN